MSYWSKQMCQDIKHNLMRFRLHKIVQERISLDLIHYSLRNAWPINVIPLTLRGKAASFAGYFN